MNKIENTAVYIVVLEVEMEGNRDVSGYWIGDGAVAICSWQNNWEDLATFFRFPAENRRLI